MNGIKILFLVKNIFQYVNGLADRIIRSKKEIAQLPKIGLQHVTMTYSSEDAYPEIWIDNKKVSIHEVAKNDGLSVEDFVEWFFGNNKENVFEGVVIHFTDFRY